MKRIKVVTEKTWSYLKPKLVSFLELLKWIFIDGTRRKDFLTFLLSDYLGLIFLSAAGFFLVLIAALSWKFYLFLVSLFAILSSLRASDKKRRENESCYTNKNL